MLNRLTTSALAIALLISIGLNARADEIRPQNPQEVKLLACWEQAKVTGNRFTIQEKEALVRACMAR